MRHAATPEDSSPEAAGGGTGRAPRLAQVPYGIALAGFLAGLAWMGGGERHVRGGTLVMAGVLLAAAIARLALPDSRPECSAPDGG